jgi:hypothetical protein
MTGSSTQGQHIGLAPGGGPQGNTVKEPAHDVLRLIQDR